MEGPIWRAFEAHWSASNLSPSTLTTYRHVYEKYLRRGWPLPPDLDLDTAREIVSTRLAEATKEASVVFEVKAIKCYSKFVHRQLRLDDPLSALRIPKADKPGPQITATAADVEKLLLQCAGRAFEDIRDHALICLFAQTGARRSEVARMTVEDLDLERGRAFLMATKAKQPRQVSIKPIEITLWRYLDKRSKHPAANERGLWLGQRGVVGVQGIGFAVQRRAAAAGLPKGFGTHAFRRRLAIEWLERGGSEVGLMQVAGWTTTAMVNRYAQARLAELAVEEQDRLFGD